MLAGPCTGLKSQNSSRTFSLPIIKPEFPISTLSLCENHMPAALSCQVQINSTLLTMCSTQFNCVIREKSSNAKEPCRFLVFERR
jgi:hypothetical protein